MPQLGRAVKDQVKHNSYSVWKFRRPSWVYQCFGMSYEKDEACLWHFLCIKTGFKCKSFYIPARPVVPWDDSYVQRCFESILLCTWWVVQFMNMVVKFFDPLQWSVRNRTSWNVECQPPYLFETKRHEASSANLHIGSTMHSCSILYRILPTLIPNVDDGLWNARLCLTDRFVLHGEFTKLYAHHQLSNHSLSRNYLHRSTRTLPVLYTRPHHSAS